MVKNDNQLHFLQYTKIVNQKFQPNYSILRKNKLRNQFQEEFLNFL